MLGLVACNGVQYRQARPMKDFQATQEDIDSVAAATFRLIDARGGMGAAGIFERI